jgi:uncharacterized membrane protein YoaK (UPF0700 family)
MFRQDKPRTFLHNLRLASMLSFVAGMVNINGVLSISTLTTNVTGHFAFFAEEFVEQHYEQSLTFILFIFFFLMGAFVCSLLIELVKRMRPNISHAIPMFMEISMLVTVAFADGNAVSGKVPIACTLLFAMGLQNALVTKISRATVRTTHLTGLFTDLGIELSQLFFYRKKPEVRKLSRSIYLRMTIIVFFFIGGVLGGLLYHRFHLKALLFAGGFLVVALLYDNLRLGMRYYFRKMAGAQRTL